MSPVSAYPRACGPMTTPPRIRNNTCGGRPGTSLVMIGASAATVITSSRDNSELGLTGQPPPIPACASANAAFSSFAPPPSTSATDFFTALTRVLSTMSALDRS